LRRIRVARFELLDPEGNRLIAAHGKNPRTNSEKVQNQWRLPGAVGG